mgnify:CR=1 FL=1
MRSFSARLIAWQEHAGRRDLPWQNTRDRVSHLAFEIMLQQTQVATVMPYYQRFLRAFPDVAIACRGSDRGACCEVWSGLGYYRRAHLLHRAAREIVDAARAALSRAMPRRLPTLPASAARPLRRSPPSPTASAARSSMATSSACWHGTRVSQATPAILTVERALWARAEASAAARATSNRIRKR